MKRSLYVYNNGDLKRKDNTLQFTSYEGEKRDIPIERINDIYVMSEMTFNTAFINYISQYGIPIHFFNYYNFYTGSYYPKESLLAGQLLVKQVEHYTDYEKRIEIARKFINAAADNIYRNLRYYNSRGKELSEFMNEVDHLRKKIPKAKAVDELMGIEGNIRRYYYTAWNEIVNQEIQFEKRVMHPPDNMINSLISFVNSLIYSKTLSEIYHTQLNPTISYLHEPGARRYSLCLDLSEVFKPLIGDRLIFSLLNRKQITEDSFTKELNFLHLKKEASKLIVTEFEDRLKTTIMHKELGKKVSYQYLMRLEAYKLIKHLIGEKEYEGFKIWWQFMYVVLVYDISQSENGQKRWSRVFKICKKYLSHIQNSVFEGEISKVQLAQLQQELKPHVDTDLDSVIIFKSRHERWLDKEFWGKEEDKTSFLL